MHLLIYIKNCMKTLALISMILFGSITAISQSVAINTDASSPNASAILDIKSINKGLLIPRMTTVQRTVIPTPAKGLIVFDITTNGLWFHNGTAWNVLSSGSSTNYWTAAGSDIYNNTAGNVSIGTTNPLGKLHIAGDVKIDGNNSIEFAANLVGKELNAGKIGYQTFTAGALDITGAGTDGTDRKIKFWNEGGAEFTGKVGIGLSAPRAKLTVLSSTVNSANNTEVIQVAGKNPMLLFSDINGNDYAYFKAITDLSQTPQFGRPGIEIGAAGNDIYLSSLGYQPALTVNGTTNNVGIGTITPLAKLHIAGNVKIDGNNTLEFGAGVAGKEASAGKIGYQTFTPGTLDIVGAGTGANRRIKFWNEGGVEFNGSVGIGYANPIAGYKLSTNGGAYINGVLVSTGDVEMQANAKITGYLNVFGSYPKFFAHYYSLQNSGGIEIYNYIENCSIVADKNIAAIAFEAYSDARIKNIVGKSNTSQDLETINAIKITDYTMKDKAMYGIKAFKKVIAQEVEKIYPQVVSKQVGFIPNVYQLTNKVEKTSNGYLLVFTNHHNISNSAKRLRIQLVDGNAMKEFDIISIPSDNEVVINATNLTTDKIFVYGEQVNDFRAVDYEGLTTLNISATQELSKLIKKQQAIIETQQQQIELLLKRMDGFEKNNQLITTNYSIIKK
jgi:uncharacterized coiled-coil protein SlyX